MKLHSIVAFYEPKLVKGFCLPYPLLGFFQKWRDFFTKEGRAHLAMGCTFYDMFKKNCER
jgi:hypothetical protein